MKIDRSNPPKGKLTLIADVNGNKLYRIEGGNWNGDFWHDCVDGDKGFIDTQYLLENEAELIADFTRDFS